MRLYCATYRKHAMYVHNLNMCQKIIKEKLPIDGTLYLHALPLQSQPTMDIK